MGQTTKKSQQEQNRPHANRPTAAHDPPPPPQPPPTMNTNIFSAGEMKVLTGYGSVFGMMKKACREDHRDIMGLFAPNCEDLSPFLAECIVGGNIEMANEILCSPKYFINVKKGVILMMIEGSHMCLLESLVKFRGYSFFTSELDVALITRNKDMIMFILERIYGKYLTRETLKYTIAMDDLDVFKKVVSVFEIEEEIIIRECLQISFWKSRDILDYIIRNFSVPEEMIEGLLDYAATTKRDQVTATIKKAYGEVV